jgi:drug/metabolite transporter (DMT)-like permease
MEYALGAAFFYAWSVTCARRSSAHHGPDLANLGRLLIAVIVIGLFVAFSDRHPFCAGWEWLILGGVLGLGIGDIALFHALPRIGVGLTMLLTQCLAAPFALILEYEALGHSPNGAQMLAALVILIGVGVALGAPAEGDPTDRRTGVWLGVLSALGQACGAVSTPLTVEACKQAGEVIPDGFAQAFVRLLGGLPVVLLFLLWASRKEGLLAKIRRPYAFASAPWWMLMNGIAGPALGVACYQWALTQHPAALVLSVVALTPLIGLIMQWAIEGQRPSWRLWLGGAIAIIGVILLRGL